MKKSKLLTMLLMTLCLGIGMCHMTEAAAKKRIKLNKTKLTMTEGKTYKLKLKNNKKKVKWSSSKKKIASVTSKGKVTAKKAGNAVITAKAAGKKYKCKVTVKAKKSTPAKTDRDFTKTLQPDTQVRSDYAANYTKLKNYIQLNGETNSSGNNFLNGSLTHDTMETNYGIVYDAANQEFEFILTTNTTLEDGSSALGALLLSVSEASIANGAVSYKVAYDSGYYGSVSGTYMLADIHSADNNLIWNLDESNIDNTEILANLCIDLGYICWANLLTDNNLELSLTDLGFGA